MTSPQQLKQRFPLRIRIPLFVFLFSVLVALGFSAMQLYVEYSREVVQIRARLKEVAISSADGMAASIWKLDEEQIQIDLKSVLRMPDIQYVRVESHDLGTIAFGSETKENVLTQDIALVYRDGEHKINVGRFYLLASLAGVRARTWDNALLILIAEGIKTFLLAVFLLLLIQLLVTRHLTRMVRYTRDLSITRLDKPLQLSRGEHYHTIDELDELVIDINAMLSGLQESHHQLQLSHNTLEKKIEERTYGITLAKEEAEKANKEKSEFLSNINHELRTPLTAIRGGIGLVVGGALGKVPESMNAALDIAYKNSDRLLMLVNDMLDVAKIEAGQLELYRQPIALKLFFEQAIALNQAYAQTFDVSIALLDYPDTLIINVDENRLMQVMNNLLSNAAKFSPPKSVIEISAKLLEHFLEISVTDHGTGIPESFKQRVFEKFTQADGSSTRKTGGTGLGLSITKSWVELHGGIINFESTENIGTRFYFTIPV